MNDFQFYPTTEALKAKAWAKFTTGPREMARTILEPSAGDGRLLAGYVRDRKFGSDRDTVHCIELDMGKHAELMEQGFKVVGVDFLQFEGGAAYSHIIMNPPFAEGARHVLKAWDILWGGEVVAIVNAETVRNPFSAERQRLAALIADHGSVEFVADAFNGPEAERRADVEVALVHLVKPPPAVRDFTADFLQQLRQDMEPQRLAASSVPEHQQLALPGDEIANHVLAFRGAVHAMRESVRAERLASHYAGLLGQTMAVRRGDKGSSLPDHGTKWEHATITERYDELKDRAWARILDSAEVLRRVSSAGAKLIQSQFQSIKQLDFTVANVHGFLLGLCEQQGSIQAEMACSVFDEILKYHSDNRVFYKGWKSNDKHWRFGMRLRSSRVVVPCFDAYSSSFTWESERRLSDFDKVFAMLDGKQDPEISLARVARQCFDQLRGAERVSSSYFDIRWYRGTKTMHFYPKRPDLVDRLNRIVGRQRQWLPPDGVHTPGNFWTQYEQAEKFDKAFRSAVTTRRAAEGARFCYRDPYWNAMHGDDGEKQRAQALLGAAMEEVLDAKGLNFGDRLEDNAAPQQLLLAA